jgi:hypothetical protein
MIFEIPQKDPADFLSPERVMEIYREITGREDQWILDSSDYVKMDEDELYELFSNMEYTRKRGDVELQQILKKPMLQSEETVRAIYREIMQQDLEYTDVYVRMTEEEMRAQLTRLTQLPGQIAEFKNRWEEDTSQSMYSEQSNEPG